MIRSRHQVEGRPLDEAELVERARNGSVAAYEELVHAYSQLAFRAAYLITRSAEEAEDAAQEAFVKAYRALPRFRQGAPWRPWLLRIVTNEARNRRRSVWRRSHLELKLAAFGPPSGDAAPSPEAAVEAAEERESLLRAVNSLDEHDRLVISCRYFLDLSVAETAETLAWAEGTVKSRLSRALERLRGRMGVAHA